MFEIQMLCINNVIFDHNSKFFALMPRIASRCINNGNSVLTFSEHGELGEHGGHGKHGEHSESSHTLKGLTCKNRATYTVQD